MLGSMLGVSLSIFPATGTGPSDVDSDGGEVEDEARVGGVHGGAGEVATGQRLRGGGLANSVSPF